MPTLESRWLLSFSLDSRFNGFPRTLYFGLQVEGVLGICVEEVLIFLQTIVAQPEALHNPAVFGKVADTHRSTPHKNWAAFP
jgi:hypothetical protein